MEPQTRKWLLTKLKAASKPVFLLLFSFLLEYGCFRCCVSFCCIQGVESAICTHVSPFFGSPSHLGRRRASRRVPWAAQWGGLSLVGCFMSFQWCECVRRSLPVHPALPFPSWCPCVCPAHLRLSSYFVNKIVYTNFVQITHICVLIHGIFLLFLTWLYSLWRCLHKYSGILLNHRK